MKRENVQFSSENQLRGHKGMSFEDAIKDAKLRLIGEGMGLSFSFIKDETIMFPKLDEVFPWTRDFRGKPMLYITGFSDKRNRFVEVPLSSFRKKPVGEGELDSFYDESKRPVNCRLAEASTDLDRIRILCELGEIKCVDIFEMHAYIFETDADNNIHRTDRLRPLRVAAIESVQ